ncbi:Diaminohydroxyphosphoribosylaminopyrimidine deaminase [Candidatus Rhodobacter oscarellae]|uniref:Riboflavin biosynthesis protein RibD n=1 Tax=Candidatus Rhodobacter oscarellae TaxID=1675527 RepID=A0A0J9E6M6_9RHOB|nr:Diaminohydroxyphosphoribosylaminopyrimidine deaminase [Candidatus Rhodobacter lobularis]
MVKDGRVVGRGWTQPGGRPHAERVALHQAGASAKGADVYVTLEPCSHYGKTPPCADALIAAGVARVVVAVGDPNPQVAGQGLSRLRAAGIAVALGVMTQEAARDHQGFLTLQIQARPMVTLKLASSVDGRIATATGESQWITGPEARRRVHLMRACHDAVLVGGGTARADDPMLNTRGLGVAHQPVRVVWSRNLDVPLSGALARTARDTPVWLCCGPSADPALQRAWEDLGARVFVVPVGTGGQVAPREALQALGEAGITRVFCEGGGALAASLLQADLVDRLEVFSAGLALGAEGRPSLGALGVDRLAEAPRFNLLGTEAVGRDVLLRFCR